MGPAAEGWMGQTVVGQKRAPALSNRPENRGLMGGLFSSVGRYGFTLWGFPIHSTRGSRKSRERVDFLRLIWVGLRAGGVHLVNSPCSSTARPDNHASGKWSSTSRS